MSDYSAKYVKYKNKYLTLKRQLGGGGKLTISAGCAAAHIYNDENCEQTQLTVDWTYDGLYYRYKDQGWITLSLGPKTEINDIHKINTDPMKSDFKRLCFHAIAKLEGQFPDSDKVLEKIQEIADQFA